MVESPDSMLCMLPSEMAIQVRPTELNLLYVLYNKLSWNYEFLPKDSNFSMIYGAQLLFVACFVFSYRQKDC